MLHIAAKRSTRVVFFSLLAPLMLLAASVYAQDGEKEMTPIPMISGIEMLKVGDAAPDFSIKDLSGNQFHMKEVLARHKGVLIFFWSIFCEPCKAELPVIQELTQEYKDKGIEFVGVAIDGFPMKDAIDAFIKQEHYSFDVIIDELNPDESFKVSDPYGVAGTPTLYLLDKTGTVQFSRVGRTPKEEIEAAFKKVL
ncbi:MAG TPA: TlpA family protein disulfide reductase [Proteobacteria bacterium]|nr:thiol-disulfide oxidoreductase ResA [bacterium BMS3Abin14]HDL53193.1 TlpA family protein disulfide reductase [Pseudomonadota bacterium]